MRRFNMRTITSLLHLAITLALAFALAACGGRKPDDALDAARAAVDGASDAERCAEAEYRAARNLLNQANEAYDNREYARATQLAEAARVQAERARLVAEANAEDCDRIDEIATEVTRQTDDAGRRGATDDVDDTRYTLDRIYFVFNESSLSDDARATLNRHADYLLRNPSINITIEGHCDERGSNAYNLALGERRARAVRAYLERLGVPASRMRVVSYGEEMPLGSNHDQNRRAEFVIR